ncbi:hypothetical protein V0288_22285 [Pannus brasiliensis CCIBt3594]|uniref:Uncharacterized protein n=1 Tax=Pannus brasiliensis CCIBt3594 TaxID=1427578 RepID=A0AAW9QYU3_9CHRO
MISRGPIGFGSRQQGIEKAESGVRSQESEGERRIKDIRRIRSVYF